MGDGEDHPILNLKERALSVLGCKVNLILSE